jgi:type IV secretory pathway protease TraF
VFDEARKAANSGLSDERVIGDGNSSWTCKRVWGLPSEQIELREGEILINGAALQKDAKQFLQVAIPVAKCQGHRSALDEKLNYVWSQAYSNTTQLSSPLTITLQAGESIHWSETVFDEYPENYSTPRSLAAVNDLVLSIEFAQFVADPARGQSNHASNGILKIEVHYHGVNAEIYCHFGDQAKVAHKSTATFHNVRQLLCGGWDNQLIAMESPERTPTLQLITQAKNSNDSSDSSPRSSALPLPSTQFRLTVVQGSICINRMTLLRDLYLRASERDSKNGYETWNLGDDEIFVIGDNLPISVDSRNGLGNVMRRQVWGVLE